MTILEQLIQDKLVWIENGAYVGRADDGEYVQVGMVGDEKQTNAYLASHPSPKNW